MTMSDTKIDRDGICDASKRTGGRRRAGLLYMGVFLCAVCVYMIVLAVEGAYPFGDACFLVDDAYVQYNTMIRVFLEYIHSGDMSGVMWNHGLGIDMYLNALYYFMSPFNIIAVVLGENHVELSLVIMIVIKCSLIPVTGLYYFRHTGISDRTCGLSGGLRTAAELCCAAAWGFCGYVLAYGQNVLWLDGLIVIPLLALGVERVNRREGFEAYVIWLAITFAVNFYYSFYVCMFVVVYYILLERQSFKEFAVNAVRLALCSLLSAVMAAVCLIPAILCVVRAGESYTGLDQTGLSMWGDPGGYVVSFFPFKELSSSGYLYNNNNYVGTAALLLMFAFFCMGSVRPVQRLKTGIVLLVFVLAANRLPLNYVFSGLTVTHGMGNRFAFILSFVIIAAAYRTLTAIHNMKMSGAALGGVCAAACLALSFTDSSRLQVAYSYITFLLASSVIVIAFVLVAKRSIRPASAAVIVSLIWIAELAANALYTLPSKSSDVSMTDSIYLSSWESGYRELDTGEGERKTSLVYSSYTPDSEVNWYSSMMNGYSVNSFISLGLAHYDNVECLYDGTTPLTALMYDVRYVLTNSYNTNGGYHKVSGGELGEGESYSVYEADELAGMGFMVDADIESWDGDGDVGDNQSEFLRLAAAGETSASGTEKLMKPVPAGIEVSESYNLGSFVRTGVGRYTYTSESTYPASVHLTFTADRDMDLYVYSYDTRDQVVMAYIDGELVAESKYYSTGQLVHIGRVVRGQQVKVSAFGGASQGETAEKVVQLYSFDNELFNEVSSELTDEVLVSDGYVGNTFTGHITAKKAGVLYLAFPYSDGYTIYVDGVNADKLLLGAGSMGVRLEAGEHVIELRYHTCGLLPGAVISLAGVAVFILLILRSRRKECIKLDICIEKKSHIL